LHLFHLLQQANDSQIAEHRCWEARLI